MLGLLFNFSVSADNTTIPEYLQSISVKLRTLSGNGSGIVFIRKDSTGKNNVSFVWTVAHLFEDESVLDITNLISTNVPSTNNVFNTSPKLANKIVIPMALLLQPVIVNGELVGTNVSTVRLIKYSPSDKDDIALTMIETNDFITNTAKFDLSNRIPRLGDKVYNLSYPYGDMSFSEGNMSYVGIKMEGYVYDQTSCVVYPGSSGGGYYTTNGLCIGVVDMMAAPEINYMIPIRRIEKWAKENGVEWALDPSLPIPSHSELEKLNKK